MVLFGDLEANGLLEEATKVHCAVFKDRDTGKLYRWNPTNIKGMCKWLDNNASCLIFHNGTFYDFPLLKKLYNWEPKCKVCDTLVISRLLNPKRTVPIMCPNKASGPHSIEAWGYRVGRGKPEYTEWGEYDEEMLHRCTEDVEILALVYEALRKEAKQGGWKGSAFVETQKLFRNLQLQAEYGWYIDRPLFDKYLRTLDRWINRIDVALEHTLPQIMEICESAKTDGVYSGIKKPFLKSGKYSTSVTKHFPELSTLDSVTGFVAGPFCRVNYRSVDLNSNMEMKDMLLNEGWKPAEWNLDEEGNRRSPKLSKDDPFNGVDGKRGKCLVQRVQARHRKSTLEGLKKLIRMDGSISSMAGGIATTGRLMHRGIVNIPHPGSFFGKQMRKIFAHRTGKSLVGCDSDAAQLRFLANRMDDDEFTYAVLHGNKDEGTDIHTLNQKKAGLPSRDKAKTFIYALLFGSGIPNLAKLLEMSTRDTEKVYDNFMSGMPKYIELVSNLNKEWSFNRGSICGLDGRPIAVESEHQILNYALQSDEAIFMTYYYNLVWERLKEAFEFPRQFGVVCWYHDEVDVECDEDIKEEVGKILEDCFDEVSIKFKLKVPQSGTSSYGYNWYDIH